MYLGIDLGTSSVKLVLIDEDQSIVAEASSPLKISHPKPLFSEQNPADWWDALNLAMKRLEKKERIKVIGLSGQMHGAVLLDASNRVLRPAILWNDGRAFRECMELEKRVPSFAKIAGTKMMPGFTAPKLLWIKKHEAELFAKIHHVLLPKDYLRFQMSKDFATDSSDASGTCLLDVGKRAWSYEMIEASHLKIEQLPRVYEGNEVTSQIDSKIASHWGLSKEVVIVAGGSDNAASAISMGVTQEAQAFLSLGTSGVYFVAAKAFDPNVEEGIHTFCHCLPNLWHQMSVHLSSASCLGWFKEILAESDFHEMIQKAEKTKILFLPYFSGIRTPYNDPHAKGVFFGLDHSSSKGEMIRSVLEGVAFDFADGQDAILKKSAIREVSVVGGGARELFWGGILASVLNRSLHYRANAEIGGALGAARLAWVSRQKGELTQLLKAPKLIETVRPSEDYRKKRAVFQQLYRQLKPCFQQEDL